MFYFHDVKYLFDCCKPFLKWLLHPIIHPSIHPHPTPHPTHPAIDFFQCQKLYLSLIISSAIFTDNFRSHSIFILTFQLFEINKLWYFFIKLTPQKSWILMQIETWILKIGPFLAYLLKLLLRYCMISRVKEKRSVWIKLYY